MTNVFPNGSGEQISIEEVWSRSRSKPTVLRFFSPLSRLPKHQVLPRYFHDIVGHGTHMVDLQNPLDLHQQTANDAKVASYNAHNRGERPP
jgi:hypothetical protein